MVPQVEAFRQGLAPDERERFHEILIRVYNDPRGTTTGAVPRVLSPLSYYVYADDMFGILYRLYKIPGDIRDRVEVFDAQWAH